MERRIEIYKDEKFEKLSRFLEVDPDLVVISPMWDYVEVKVLGIETFNCSKVVIETTEEREISGIGNTDVKVTSKITRLKVCLC